MKKRGRNIFEFTSGVILTILIFLMIIFLSLDVKTFLTAAGESACSEGEITSACICNSQVKTSGYCCNNKFYIGGCFDRYGGYKGVKSQADAGYNGVVTDIPISSNKMIIDGNANLPNLAGRYLVFNNIDFSDPSNLRIGEKFLITSNDATTITTQENLIGKVSIGDEYQVIKASPYFTTEKINNRLWFITPEGNAYWIVGEL